MGWWGHNPNGVGSDLFNEHNGQYGAWGDGPADAMDDALDRIVKEFLAMGDYDLEARLPTKAEIRRGLEFSLAGHDELKEE